MPSMEADVFKEKINELAAFINERYFYNKPETLDNKVLFSNGAIDSISVLELILKIEELFETEFFVQYLIDDKADTIQDIEKTIQRVLEQNP